MAGPTVVKAAKAALIETSKAYSEGKVQPALTFIGRWSKRYGGTSR
jgi:hypothetical protein